MIMKLHLVFVKKKAETQKIKSIRMQNHQSIGIALTERAREMFAER